MQYRILNPGEIIQQGDEWLGQLRNWEKSQCAGLSVPTGLCPIVYRRAIEGSGPDADTEDNTFLVFSDQPVTQNSYLCDDF